MHFKGKNNRTLCTKYEVQFMPKSETAYCTESDIEAHLKKEGVKYKGLKQNEIDLNLIESALKKLSFVSSADCYFSLNGTLSIEIVQRIPIIRVYPSVGKPYYLDNYGKAFDLTKSYSADVLVASGNINHGVDKILYTFANHVHQSDFWNHFIEHIFVDARKDLRFTTQVAGHEVVFGDTLRMSQKLTKLEDFYKKSFENEGWENFKEVNIKFKDQVICRK
ncbi:MAG: cell division protein FtsQ [Bacteroidia bacterium]|jgi:cell division protein FtsQ